MRVLVTGGTGSVGKATIARLVAHGHTVLVIGRRECMEVPDADYAVCDITDRDSLREKAEGCDAIVHLAAIPHPRRGQAPEVFRVNAAGTFNVFQAATDAGIRRVVQASSINALGNKFGYGPLPVEYFPIDEEHPTCTTDEYSFSKTVIEDIGRYFWRREGITSVALRIPWVYASESEHFGEHRARLRELQPEIQALLEGPEDARQAIADQVHKGLEWIHTVGNRGGKWPKRGERPKIPPVARALIHTLPDFCTMVDERDSAQAIEKGLTADYEGSHVLFINEAQNVLGCDSEKLVQMMYPEVAARKRPLVGAESLISIDRARELIGFAPDHSFT